MQNDQKLAEVISIDDPDKVGRSQLRIIGIHDDKINIPDKDLPWAVLRRPPDDPAINKIGSGGNPLLVGTIVTVRSWDLGSSHQNWIIEGTVPKSGDQQGNVTSNGTTKIDKSKSDTPTASRTKDDVNTVVTNPIKDSKTTPGSKTDEGGKNIYNDIMKVGAKFKDHPTISTLKEVATSNLLDIIKKVDPGNIGGAVKNSLDQLMSMKHLDQMTSKSGLSELVAQILKTNLQESGAYLTKDAFGVIVQSLIAIAQSQNLNPFITDMLKSIGDSQDMTIASSDSLDAVKSEITALLQRMNIRWNFDDPEALYMQLISTFNNLLQSASQSGDQQAFGGTDLNNIAQTLKSCGSNIESTVTKLTTSVLDQSKIKDTLKQFARAHQILDKKEEMIKGIFNG